MLKSKDKDSIIEFLKKQLEQICNYEIPSSMRIDDDEQFIYKTIECPECGDSWEEEIKIPAPEGIEKAVSEDTVDALKEIAEKALNEVTF